MRHVIQIATIAGQIKSAQEWRAKQGDYGHGQVAKRRADDVLSTLTSAANKAVNALIEELIMSGNMLTSGAMADNVITIARFLGADMHKSSIPFQSTMILPIDERCGHTSMRITTQDDTRQTFITLM